MHQSKLVKRVPRPPIVCHLRLLLLGYRSLFLLLPVLLILIHLDLLLRTGQTTRPEAILGNCHAFPVFATQFLPRFAYSPTLARVLEALAFV